MRAICSGLQDRKGKDLAMRNRSAIEQQAYELSFGIGFGVNLPEEAYRPEDWEEMERRKNEADASDDVVEQGYLAGRLAQREYKFGK